MKIKSSRSFKIIAIALSLLLIFQQSGLSQIAGELDLSSHFLGLRNTFSQDIFRPLHLRYLSYDPSANNFNLLLDKGDFLKGLSPQGTNPKDSLQQETKTLLKYFFIGISLPNESFWVNLRPDSPDNIIDPELAETDVGKILLEADLQLKKDTANFTSPQTPEGKDYWDKLYKKAEELYGSESITIPTLTRPWIVPDEIIIRESSDNAYIYKATLKVMLEQDYLKDSSTYSFPDQRSKALNEYSSQLIRETIIPKLTKEINSSKRYAPLRQVYYSLILAQWFKQKFYGKSGVYSYLIDRHKLDGLTSKTPWSKTTYFNAYKTSFQQGEYNIKEPRSTLYGQTIRSYMSGGIEFCHTISSAITKNLIHATMQQKPPAAFLQSHNIGVQVTGSLLIDNPEQIKISFPGSPEISAPSALDSVPAGQPQNQAKPGKEQELVTSASPVQHPTEGSLVDKHSNREKVNFLGRIGRAMLKPVTKILGLIVLGSTLAMLPYFYGDMPIIGDALTIINKIHFNIARYIPLIDHGSIPQQISNDKYFQEITRSMPKASKHSIGSCIYRLLKRSALELSPENIRKAGELIINMRDSVSSQDVFSASRKVINITHANVSFDLNSMISLESAAGVSMSNISSFKGGKDKQAALNEIAGSKGALTIYFSGHGGKKHFWLVNSIVQGRERPNDVDSPAGISYQELGDALIKKGDLAGTKIIFDACYSYNYAVNLLEHLTNNGAKDLPILIGADNFNREGFGEAFYTPLKNAYQKHRGPLIMQDIFDAEEEGSALQDYAVFIPIDKGYLPRDFIPALSTGQVIGLDWKGLNGVIGIPTGILEISRSNPVNTDDGKLASVSLRRNAASSSAIKDIIPRMEPSASAAGSPLQQTTLIKKISQIFAWVSLLLVGLADPLLAFNYSAELTPGGQPREVAIVNPGDALEKAIVHFAGLRRVTLNKLQLDTLIKEIKASNLQITNEHLIFPGQKVDFSSTVSSIRVIELLSKSNLIAKQELEIQGRKIKVYFIEPANEGGIGVEYAAFYTGDNIVVNIKRLSELVRQFRAKSTTPDKEFPGLQNFFLYLLGDKTDREMSEIVLNEIVFHEIIHQITRAMVANGKTKNTLSQLLSNFKLAGEYGYEVSQELAAYLGQIAYSSEPKLFLYLTYAQSTDKQNQQYYHVGNMVSTYMLDDLGYIDYIVKKEIERARQSQGSNVIDEEAIKKELKAEYGKYFTTDYIEDILDFIIQLPNQKIKDASRAIYETFFGPLPAMSVDIPNAVLEKNREYYKETSTPAASSPIQNPTFEELSTVPSWQTDRDGRKIWSVGRVEGSGKQLRIEDIARESGKALVLDSSQGYKVVAIEGFEKEPGVAKLFVLKHEINLPTIFRYKRMQRVYNLRDNGKRSQLARELLSLLLQDPQFNNYAIKLPEVQVIEIENDGDIETLIATEYINPEEYGRVAVLKSRPLAGPDRSGEIAEKLNHALLDVFFGALLYQEDREYLVIKGEGKEELVPFDFDTALAPLYYYKNGPDHAYNASGFLLKGEAQDYEMTARQIGNYVLNNKNKIMDKIKEIWGSPAEGQNVALGKDGLLNVTSETIWDFLEAQASRIEDVVRVALNDKTVKSEAIGKEASEKRMWGDRLPADLKFILSAQGELPAASSPAVDQPNNSSPVRVSFTNHPGQRYSKEESENIEKILKARNIPENSKIFVIGAGFNPVSIIGYDVINIDQHYPENEKTMAEYRKIHGISDDYKLFKGDLLDTEQNLIEQLGFKEKPAAVVFYNMWEFFALYGPGAKWLEAEDMARTYFNAAKKIVAPGGEMIFVQFMPPGGSGTVSVIAPARNIIEGTPGYGDIVEFANTENGSIVGFSAQVKSSAGSPARNPVNATGSEKNGHLGYLAERSRLIQDRLQRQTEILAPFTVVQNLQEEFPGTLKADDIETLITKNRGEEWAIDLSRRIAVATDDEWGKFIDDPVTRGLVEGPAQMLVTKIRQKGGLTSWSNAYGPYLYGVVWTMDGAVFYFTPLMENDYIAYEHLTLPGASPVGTTNEKIDDSIGGIDMRSLPKYTKVEQVAAGSPLSKQGQFPPATEASAGRSGAVPVADKEWQEIEKMANSGIAPSCERIREYLLSLQDPSAQADKVLACIVDILRQEEEKACGTESSLKEILVLLESGKPANELRLALINLQVLAKEPQLLIQ